MVPFLWKTLGLAVVGAVCVIGFGVARGWDSTREYEVGFFSAALILVGVGSLSVLGGMEGRGDTVGYAASVSRMPLADRVGLAARDLDASYRFLLAACAAGACLALVGVLIPS